MSLISNSSRVLINNKSAMIIIVVCLTNPTFTQFGSLSPITFYLYIIYSTL
nr:hypothetical protein SY271_000829 [Bacillus thuringiensis]